MYTRTITLVFITLFVLKGVCFSASKLISMRIDKAPNIDGVADETQWSKANEIITHDRIAGLDISIRSLHTSDRIYFLVKYKDPDESRLHKPWIWNKELELYEQGAAREDTFVFKWAMDNASTKDLSIYADAPYTADVWFWKANRTNPSGYADDKIQILSTKKMKKTMQIQSHSGDTMFLRRKGDSGKPAYRSVLQVDFQGDRLPQFKKQAPSGSRADIKAKGVWADNSWVIEFSRALKTSHPDDIQFDVDTTYFFGVSRYEIAGRKPDSSLSQPLYGSGDVSGKLILSFEH